jgi:hypothetical protein
MGNLPRPRTEGKRYANGGELSPAPAATLLNVLGAKSLPYSCYPTVKVIVPV